MIILLVGPAGVGKTSACRTIEHEFPDCLFRDLDELAPTWAVAAGIPTECHVQRLREYLKDDDLFLAIGLAALADVAARNPNKHLVIDVGAGFQDANYAENLHRAYPVIAITAEPQVVYRRLCGSRGDPRTLQDYADREFAPGRRRLYANCRFQIDTSRLTTAEQTATEVREKLRLLITEGR
jgi:shikimate kinase